MDTKSFESIVMQVRHSLPSNTTFVVIALDDDGLNLGSNLNEHEDVCSLLSKIASATPTSKSVRPIADS